MSKQRRPVKIVVYVDTGASTSEMSVVTVEELFEMLLLARKAIRQQRRERVRKEG